jgi:YesN/AraC family two-component response regulator
MQLTCLIIEDAAFMREIYHYSLLKCENIRVIGEACDGEEALKLLSQFKPDIMLLDLVLPVKSGLDVLKEVSLVSPKTKAIVVSSIEDENIIQRAKALGVITYIKKPFTKVDLVNAFEEISKNYSEVQNG